MKTPKKTQSKINLLKAQIQQMEEGHYHSPEQRQKMLPILKKRLKELEDVLQMQIDQIKVRAYEEL